jgi:hypothetical protein
LIEDVLKPRQATLPGLRIALAHEAIDLGIRQTIDFQDNETFGLSLSGSLTAKSND